MLQLGQCSTWTVILMWMKTWQKLVLLSFHIGTPMTSRRSQRRRGSTGYLSLMDLAQVLRDIGGSKSAVAYSYEMARDKGISIRDTVYPTFQKLHYSEAEKSYTTAKAKRIADEVECGLEDLSQTLPDGVSPTPADTTEIFIGAAQNPKKNRVFGVGTLYSPPSVSSGWEAGGSGFRSMGNEDPLVNERFEKLQAEYEAEKNARQELERRQGGLEENQQRLMDQLSQQQRLLDQLLRRDTQTDD